MIKTSKAFTNITNTDREDWKVERVLSGWEFDASLPVVDVAALNHATWELRGSDWDACRNSSSTSVQQRLNVSSKVLSVPTAYLVRYYPQLKALGPAALIVKLRKECFVAAGIPTADLLMRSVTLNNDAASPAEEQTQHQENAHACQGCHLSGVIKELIATNRSLAARLTIVEAALLKSKGITTSTEEEQVQDKSEQEPQPKRRNKPTTNLSAVWYEWYTRVPSVWDSADRQKKSESRHVVAFMKLFLDGGFILDAKAEDYKDQFLDTGRRAEANVLAFLKARGVNAKGAGSVLCSLRPLYKSGPWTNASLSTRTTSPSKRALMLHR